MYNMELETNEDFESRHGNTCIRNISLFSKYRSLKIGDYIFDIGTNKICKAIVIVKKRQ